MIYDDTCESQYDRENGGTLRMVPFHVGIDWVYHRG